MIDHEWYKSLLASEHGQHLYRTCQYLIVQSERVNFACDVTELQRYDGRLEANSSNHLVDHPDWPDFSILDFRYACLPYSIYTLQYTQSTGLTDCPKHIKVQ